jgi:zinc and cadmium transporter
MSPAVTMDVGFVCAVLAATTAAGVGSVLLARLMVSRHRPLSPADGTAPLAFAMGTLLAAAFLHLLPEAFEHGVPATPLFVTLLCGLLCFFVLDKVEAGRAEPGHGRVVCATRRRGTWAVIAGDAMHCVSDGVVIAAAFDAAPTLGLVATIAVFAHEVPHHAGDFAVLQGLGTGNGALRKLLIAGSMTAVGGMAGSLALERMAPLMPYLIVLSCSSFIYVSLAGLVPRLQRRLPMAQTRLQLAGLLSGLLVVPMLGVVAGDKVHARTDRPVPVTTPTSMSPATEHATAGAPHR